MTISICEMTLEQKKRDAFALLCSLADVKDFHSKLSKGEEGYMRTAAVSHLCRLYSFPREISEEVIDTYIDHAAKWHENIKIGTGGDNE